MEREIVFEVFTINGWVKVSRDTYWRYQGKKRWYWEDDKPEDN